MIGVLLGLTLAGALFLIVYTWRRWRARRLVAPLEERCGWTEGPNYCGRELTGRQVHMVVAYPQDATEEEFGGVGGTAVAMAFCARHCPGGCTNRRCRAKLPV